MYYRIEDRITKYIDIFYQYNLNVGITLCIRDILRTRKIKIFSYFFTIMM